MDETQQFRLWVFNIIVSLAPYVFIALMTTRISRRLWWALLAVTTSVCVWLSGPYVLRNTRDLWEGNTTSFWPAAVLTVSGLVIAILSSLATYLYLRRTPKETPPIVDPTIIEKCKQLEAQMEQVVSERNRERAEKEEWRRKHAAAEATAAVSIAEAATKIKQLSENNLKNEQLAERLKDAKQVLRQYAEKAPIDSTNTDDERVGWMRGMEELLKRTVRWSLAHSIRVQNPPTTIAIRQAAGALHGMAVNLKVEDLAS